MSAGRDLRATAERMEGLLGDLGRVADPGARLLAEELVRQLMELYGGGLARIVELAAQPSAPPPTSPSHGDGGLLARFAADDLVASLLILHGLHPDDPETRVRAALERVRPYLGSHGGDVELLGIDSGGRARLRMKGSCQGCPSSAVTIKMEIETAIEEAAPELAGIEVEGLGDTPAAPAPAGRDLVQLGGGAARPRPGAGGAGGAVAAPASPAAASEPDPPPAVA
jgi:Fe-S cluster biogenesis protein NfuA